MHFRARGLALVATVGLVAAACGGGDADTGAGTTTEPTGDGAAAAEGQLLVWADETRVDAINEVGEQFTSDTGVTVRVVEKAGDNIRADFETQAPAGQGPDVIVGAHDWIGNFIANGLIVPVELGDNAALYEQVAIDAFSFEGQTYGLPYAIENIALLRNTDLAPDKPGSWDEMIATGQELVDSGDAKLPFAVQMNGEAGDPYHFYPLQTSFGSFVFGQTEDGTWNPDDVQLDNDGGIEFANWLGENGEGGTGVFSTSVTGDIAITEFNEGRLPFWITGPWNVGGAQDAGINLVVEEIPSPGGDVAAPFVGVQGFMISNFSENKLLANEFVVNYLGTEDLALQLYEIGDRAPAMISALEQVSSDPIIAGFAEVGAAGSPLPNIPEMAAVWTEWGNAEGAIVLGRGDPEKLWTTMADKVRDNIAAGG
jgi:arabinogalactan oligomer / maltooligosaccharide transport system substrate-binding protein